MNKLLIIFYIILLASCNSSSRIVKDLSSKNYSLKYYGDWYVDSLESDFDKEHSFTINSQEADAFISFDIIDYPVKEVELLKAKIDQHLNQTITNATVTSFDTWGKYKGKGARIKGNIMGLMEGQFIIFIHSEANHSFVMMSQILDNDEQKYKANLNLIADQFQLKN
jgi:hypothetical protein